jgi:hypothetical protein
MRQPLPLRTNIPHVDAGPSVRARSKTLVQMGERLRQRITESRDTSLATRQHAERILALVKARARPRLVGPVMAGPVTMPPPPTRQDTGPPTDAHPPTSLVLGNQKLSETSDKVIRTATEQCRAAQLTRAQAREAVARSRRGRAQPNPVA